MKVKEAIEKLTTAGNYAQARITVSDSLIEFIKNHKPIEYDLIREKEELYQGCIKLLKNLNKKGE